MMSCVELNQPRKGFPGLRYMGCDKRIIVSQNAALIISIYISDIFAPIQRNTHNLLHYPTRQILLSQAILYAY